MKLSEKQQKKVIEKFKSLSSDGCKLCHSELVLNQHIFELKQFDGGDFNVGGGVLFPVVVFTCKKCGYTQFFNAVFLGVLDRDE